MFRFGEPIYLYLLFVLPVLIGLYLYSNWRRRKKIRQYGDPELLAHLMPDVSKYRPDVKFWLVFAALAMVIFMLARPQFGSKMETVKRQGVETVVALDISNSMLAEDVTPSRLEKSKKLISRLVETFNNDKVAMIVFAGEAFTQLPITSDYISAKMFLETISPSLISTQGTDIRGAIDLAMKSFTPNTGVGRAMCLLLMVKTTKEERWKQHNRQPSKEYVCLYWEWGHPMVLLFRQAATMNIVVIKMAMSLSLV